MWANGKLVDAIAVFTNTKMFLCGQGINHWGNANEFRNTDVSLKKYAVNSLMHIHYNTVCLWSWLDRVWTYTRTHKHTQPYKDTPTHINTHKHTRTHAGLSVFFSCLCAQVFDSGRGLTVFGPATLKDSTIGIASHPIPYPDGWQYGTGGQQGFQYVCACFCFCKCVVSVRMMSDARGRCDSECARMRVSEEILVYFDLLFFKLFFYHLMLIYVYICLIFF